MFKSTRLEIEQMINNQINSHAELHLILSHQKEKQHISCETCGCLIAPEFAVAGEKEIRRRSKEYWDGNTGRMFTMVEKEDYIYTPYYCKLHAPKGRK